MTGEDVTSIQEFLGHADIKTTMRYAHLSQEYKKNAVRVMEKEMGMPSVQPPLVAVLEPRLELATV